MIYPSLMHNVFCCDNRCPSITQIKIKDLSIYVQWNQSLRTPVTQCSPSYSAVSNFCRSHTDLPVNPLPDN